MCNYCILFRPCSQRYSGYYTKNVSTGMSLTVVISLKHMYNWYHSTMVICDVNHPLLVPFSFVMFETRMLMCIWIHSDSSLRYSLAVVTSYSILEPTGTITWIDLQKYLFFCLICEKVQIQEKFSRSSTYYY